MMQRVHQKEYEGTNEDVMLNNKNNDNHNITFIISNSDGNGNVINESPRESIIRTTSSVYNPVEFLEYLASQEQYLPNVIDVVDNTDHYNNDNEMIKNPHQKSSSEPPLSNIYSGINKRPSSSPLHLSPLEEVQNQIVGLTNSQSHSILDYQNNSIIDDNIANNNLNIITNNNLINQNQNNFISIGDINNNINVSNNNTNPQPQSTQLDNNTTENNRLKLSNVLLTRNTSRISSPKYESPPDIISAYTAQIQSSETPLLIRDNNVNNDNNCNKIIIPSRGVYNNNVTNVVNNSSVGINSNDSNDNNINNDSDTKSIFIETNNEPQSPVSPVSKSTDQQSLIPSKKPKSYKVKSGAFIMCLEIFILGVIILISWEITDSTGGSISLFNITTGIGAIPIIYNKTTTNIQNPS